MDKPKPTGELRELYVVKSNNLIRHSRYRLTLQENKIVEYLISQVKPEAENFNEVQFAVADFCKICGMSDAGKNYSNVKKAIKDLADKSAWVKTADQKEILVRWIDGAIVDHKTGIFDIKLSDNLKPYLLNLLSSKNYTQHQLYYILGMKSSYGARIYEMLKSYESAKDAFTISIDDLKRKLGIENKYKQIVELKSRVLDAAMKDINEVSDLSANYELIKDGRKYTSVTFAFRTKKQQERIAAYAETEKRFNPPDKEKIALFESMTDTSAAPIGGAVVIEEQLPGQVSLFPLEAAEDEPSEQTAAKEPRPKPKAGQTAPEPTNAEAATVEPPPLAAASPKKPRKSKLKQILEIIGGGN